MSSNFTPVTSFSGLIEVSSFGVGFWITPSTPAISCSLSCLVDMVRESSSAGFAVELVRDIVLGV